jgi:hypothetical protein
MAQAAQVLPQAAQEVLKIGLPPMFQILMTSDDPWKKEMAESICLIALVVIFIVVIAMIFCYLLGTQNGHTVLSIVVMAVFGIFVVKEIIALKHDMSSRVEMLEKNIVLLDQRVTVLEETQSPYNCPDVPPCCDAFEDHKNATQLELIRIDVNITSLDNRLTALELRSPQPTPGPAPPGPIPSPAPEPFCADCPERIAALESQVESLTADGPQTCNAVGSWMEAVHKHRVSHLNDRRGDIEAALGVMYADADKVFGGGHTLLAKSIKSCTSDADVTYMHKMSICENRAMLDDVDTELMQLKGPHEYHSLLPVQLQRRIKELNSTLIANHKEVNSKIAAQDKELKDLALQLAKARGQDIGIYCFDVAFLV